MTEPTQPRDWFPGVDTGPRVAISLDSTDVATIRGMLDNRCLASFQTVTARRVLRELDIRSGAIAELRADDDPEPGTAGDRLITGIPLQPAEYDVLRAAYDTYLQVAYGHADARIHDLFTDLDRRYGAAQIRLAATGLQNADIPAQRHDGEAQPPGAAYTRYGNAPRYDNF